jgi:parvulin-like peptidyl-prolyl isomerase
MSSVMRNALAGLVLVGTLGACSGEETKSTAKSAGGGGEPADIGEVLATVNGEKVGSEEFKQAAARKVPANGESLSVDERKEVLDTLVEEKLLYGEALKKGLDRDPKVQKVMVNTLLRNEVYSTVRNSDFTDESLQAYYDAHKSEFIVPEKVQIKRILVKVTAERPDDQAKAEAEKLRKEVNANPDSFKDVAARSSEDPYKRRGGDVGFVSKEGKPGLDQAIVDKAFSLETGATSEVFKTADGYNIVQVASRREQVERTFQQMKGSVLRKVKNEKMKSLYDGYVSQLKTGAAVKVDDDKLQAVQVTASRKPFAAAGEEGEEEGMEEGPPGEGMEGAPVPPTPPKLQAPPGMPAPAPGN